MNSTILDISGKYYTLTDTLASDGNCLYHALALTLHVSHKQLRSKTMEAILKLLWKQLLLIFKILIFVNRINIIFAVYLLGFIRLGVMTVKTHLPQ
jgi:hypothetical protein